ncbi:hypothetical protein DFH09DRAFT_1097339 [Mycena vulgaris]|nr:hypothetical protein DFH09DRAFT_1097339 [Mycena vulgaris]
MFASDIFKTTLSSAGERRRRKHHAVGPRRAIAPRSGPSGERKAPCSGPSGERQGGLRASGNASERAPRQWKGQRQRRGRGLGGAFPQCAETCLIADSARTIRCLTQSFPLRPPSACIPGGYSLFVPRLGACLLHATNQSTPNQRDFHGPGRFEQAINSDLGSDICNVFTRDHNNGAGARRSR